jgi:hypothetical protein
VGDVVGGVVVADVLQRGGDGFDQVGLLDDVVMVVVGKWAGIGVSPPGLLRCGIPYFDSSPDTCPTADNLP